MSDDHRNPNFESPLQQRSVQWTLVAFASIVLIAVVLTLQASLRSNPSTSDQTPRTQGDDGVVHIDINRAKSYELALLPGVGPVLADRIVEDRDRNGEFISVEDLRRVFGIGPKTLDEIRRLCVVGNETAKEDESRPE